MGGLWIYVFGFGERVITSMIKKFRIIYTRHAEDKLQRSDIRKFNINKRLIEKILIKPEVETKTKSGELAAISQFEMAHDLLIVYDIIDQGIRVITFFVSRKGRYKWS